MRNSKSQGASIRIIFGFVLLSLVLALGGGLEGDNARSFMADMHTRRVYLDTGLMPIPKGLLDEISEYTGLRAEIMPVSLDQLLASIQDAEKSA